MSRTAAMPVTTRRALSRAALGLSAVVVVTAVIVGVAVYQAASSPASSFVDALPGAPGTTGDAGGVSAADGALPEGVSVFDDHYAGVAGLDDDLLRALREAGTDAAADGIRFHVNSGWRSPAYQDRLLREAVWEYGSEAEAARWVATADTSPHVAGDAVDIGPAEAAAWLSRRGAAYGLCQTYGNEPWHYELRPEAIDHGCPGMFADPTADPRMRQ